ncbi:hypothetical protein Tco_0412221 [Tanacetum coccineum]
MLKQQYGNFKAEGSETLEQTFNRLQAIVSQLEFLDVPVEQEDLNQKFLTSLSPEWLMHTIVWRNRNDLDTMSLDDLYNHLKVYESEVQKKGGSSSQNMAFISSSNTNSGKSEVPTAQSFSTASGQVTTGPEVWLRNHRFMTDKTEAVQSIDNQRVVNVYRARDIVRKLWIVQHTGNRVYNCKEFGTYSKRNVRNQRARDSADHKRKDALWLNKRKVWILLRQKFVLVDREGMVLDDEPRR